MSDDASWGGTDSMNAFESLMWRVEPISNLRSTCVIVELLASTPRWLDVLAAHEQLTRRAPRLRQRVVEPPPGVALPRWTLDPHFDLGYHVRRARVPAGGGYADLLEAAELSAMSGFDRSRSPWEAVLYEGLPDGRAAYVLKLHHAMTDGRGLMAMLEHLHAAPEMPAIPGGAGSSERSGRSLTGLDVVRLDATGRMRALPGLARQIGVSSLKRAMAPTQSARSGLEYASSLRRVMTPPAAKPSPLLKARGRAWRFAALDVDFPSLRAAAKATGGSVNDAFLAGLLGGYRLYHEKLGSPVEKIPVVIPIALRSAAESSGGNEIASARLAAPIGEPDPAVRIAEIGRTVRAARAEPALNNINALAPLLARAPLAVAAKALETTAAANDLQASNVAGPPPAVLAGVPVERIHGWGPLPGCPAMVTLISYDDVACVGVNFDPAAFTDPELFVECLCSGFDEVLALAPDAFTPTFAR
jgi:WS/DGAT/MGAT family acyltransferase